jgi:hypothetical protein
MNTTDRAEYEAAYIEQYRAGLIGPVVFRAYLVRLGGYTATEIQELVDAHRDAVPRAQIKPAREFVSGAYRGGR